MLQKASAQWFAKWAEGRFWHKPDDSVGKPFETVFFLIPHTARGESDINSFAIP